MGVRTSFCENESTFNWTFGSLVAVLIAVIIVGIIIIVLLCIDNRRRKSMYKTKYRTSVSRETKASDQLNRVITYLAYKRKTGQLKPAEKIKAENPGELINDKSMDEYRNIVAANITYFFRAEPMPLSKESPSSSPEPNGMKSPQSKLSQSTSSPNKVAELSRSSSQKENNEKGIGASIKAKKTNAA